MTELGIEQQPAIEEVKALNGKLFAQLNEREAHVLNFYHSRGRKYGVSIAFINEATTAELTNASSHEEADAILKSANSKITVNVAPSYFFEVGAK